MTDKIIAVLNQLLEAEQSAIAIRLAESTLFVSMDGAREKLLVDQIAQQNRTHAKWLAEAVINLGGTPGLRSGDVHTADLHFCDVSSTLERLADDVTRFIELYEEAGRYVGSNRIASDLVNRILADHKQSDEDLVTVTLPTS